MEASVPPLDRIFLIGIWVETLIYGMNIIVFTAAIFVLARLQKARQASIRFLTGTSIFLIMLSTAYVGLSLRELIQAFILGPPGGASLFFADTAGHLSVAKFSLLGVNLFAQVIILIWRMWVVYQHRWMVIVLPFIFELAGVTAGIFALNQITHPNITIFDPVIHNTVIAFISLHLVVNVGVTSSIAYTLWKAGRSVPDLGISSQRTHPYMGLILTIVESGGVYTAAIIVAASLYFSGNIAALAAIDSLIQLATITPLLIIVRVGFGIQHGGSVNTTIYSSPTIHTSATKTQLQSGLRFNTSDLESQSTFGDSTLVLAREMNTSNVEVWAQGER